MTRSAFTRMAGTTIALGIAALAFAVPASARTAPDPDTGGLVIPAPTSQGVDSSSDGNWRELGLGAVGGLAIAGAGIAAASGLRHRHTATVQ
jgi:hypothetical protein